MSRGTYLFVIDEVYYLLWLFPPQLDHGDIVSIINSSDQLNITTECNNHNQPF